MVFWILFVLAGDSAVCGAFGGFGGVVSFGFACGWLIMVGVVADLYWFSVICLC